MSLEVKESIIIAIELLIFSVLLIIIAIFGGFARNALIRKNLQNDAMTNIKEYRNMYEFTEGIEVTVDEMKTFGYAATNYKDISAAFCQSKNATATPIANIVSGDDIIRFIGLYPYEHQIYIKLDNTKNIVLDKGYNISSNLSEQQLKVWDMSTLVDIFGEDIGSDFYCVAIYDEWLYEYAAIVFVKK